ncbi:bifunctional hydroxymethylpyrimidine kinase/phosphomethylpyrimidine kinase [Nitrososphaera viennensis]|uniref:Bifunctional hydroxymethylpyrimidine kinase/phosphomethylpyrimidine kinase n=2 Tax=Nitrososphaera viennensis TaxID=1034015 RepID=A0A977NNJ0_9ARCH|nr:bifunctional hydroxymethylpyrimidine kinase/phosphomethylpyrimidine kinase [Nitrososphaera viennensis]UVS69830.1 bifunctional hydroxymethylpyrimidine kinase/phosphomethylpyrimidine kinase [Nitrososphaera viennensis]
MKVALSIAGSDSGAGAGIQADLKTFSALGVYGCTAITALTAQNTKKVAEIHEVPAGIVEAQVTSIMTDLPPAAIKVGMVYSREIIGAITKSLKHARAPIVLDPILAAGTGAKLLRDDALDLFVSRLIPLATLVTPNRMEAEKLSGVRIRSEGDGVEAAKKLRALGAKNVIVKGGHFGKKTVTDILLLDNSSKVTEITNPRVVDIKESHGSGCNFSAAATAYLARGLALEEACRLANEYVHDAIKNAVTVGKGLPVTNPLSAIYKDAMRHRVLAELQAAVDRLVSLEGFYRLVPETQTNFAYALPDASSHSEVAAVRGRIARAGNAAVQVSRVEFGASRHMASAVLAYMSIRPSTRAVANIRLDPAILAAFRSLFEVSSYDRSKEPQDVKRKEGSTISWGTKAALSKNPEAEVIYHEGDVGKEPMITVFGRNPAEVVYKIEQVLKIC